MKVVTVVGARPQFVKAAVVSRALQEIESMTEILVHTGQHYDPMMTDIFFDELQIPKPDVNLGIGSAGHGMQTGRMLEKLDPVLEAEAPDWVLVYGDTNSTLAGALAAAKQNIPVAHVEAGLRSFNRRMPEEINRLLADQISSILFAPTAQAVANLRREGVEDERIQLIGDVMYDAALFYAEAIQDREPASDYGRFALATVHRAENTDDPNRLRTIMDALSELAASMTVVLPLHPRTRKRLEELHLLERYSADITFTEPLGYLDMIAHERDAALILTDSGGVQKEAYFFRTPCVTLRDETEWTELVDLGWNRLAPPTSPEAIKQAVEDALALELENMAVGADAAPYGDGTAGEKITAALVERSH